jgi:hypothetical protein
MEAKKPTVISSSLQESLSIIFSRMSGKCFLVKVSLIEQINKPAFEGFNLVVLGNDYFCSPYSDSSSSSSSKSSSSSSDLAAVFLFFGFNEPSSSSSPSSSKSSSSSS